MNLSGLGFWIWKIKDCELGDPIKIADAAKNANFSQVFIKIADGPYCYNYDTINKIDRIPPVVSALRSKGIKVWGWHYIYGNNPYAEADIAVSQISKYQLDGYVIDAEGEFEQAGKDVVAKTFINKFRANLPNYPVALSSYRWPSYHPRFPWKVFLDQVNYNIPQMYWITAHNPGAQLQRCIDEFKNIFPNRPIYPVGPTFIESGWSPTAAEEIEFYEKVKSLNLTGASWFSWDECKRDLPQLWNTIAQFSPITNQTNDIFAETLINYYSNSSGYKLLNLYNDDAVMVLADKTIKGKTAILNYYFNFYKLYPSGKYYLLGCNKNSNSYTINWRADLTTRKLENGLDTVGMRNGKIAYHYRSFSLV